MINVVKKILRAGEGKKLKYFSDKATSVFVLEEEISKLSDDKLKAKTQEFKERLKAGETLDDLLPEAFAAVRETAKRTLNMRHFDVQIMGGIVLYEGMIAEMATGEGKTLVATLPAYLGSLRRGSVHIVTVNDYLAKRDTQWMGPIYHFLGTKVGIIQHEASYLYDPSYVSEIEGYEHLKPVSRKEVYGADVVYGTNNEFGFDYLRDNLAIRLEDRVQRDHSFAIVDEVDSILIDEARTPLIISGPAEERAEICRVFDCVVRNLKEKRDYEVDEKTRTIWPTDEGIGRVEKALGVDDLYASVNDQLVNHLVQALKAHALFQKDVDYVVKDGEAVIVDEFTGRLMFGRRFSEGLHEAIEAKENVKVKEESKTLATITLQNYFRMYEKLAGMSGTATGGVLDETDLQMMKKYGIAIGKGAAADEFRKTYQEHNLDVYVVPTNEPVIRKDLVDVIYKAEEAKFNAVVDDIVDRSKKGQPVLVGTVSIEKSEKLSKMLGQKGVAHQVLNAKYHAYEAQIIAQAGRKGAVTIATNMAGRGVDILLGGNPEGLAREMLRKKSSKDITSEDEKQALLTASKLCKKEKEEVIGVGGLHVIGTERHEARRIDNQLRGRSGRQGDPGSSQFYLSLGDDLMRLFGSERIGKVMETLKFPDDMPIEHPLVTKSIMTAQRQVEEQNYLARQYILEYDDVMNEQRKVIYSERYKILEGEDLGERIEEILSDAVQGVLLTFTHKGAHPEEWDLDGLFAYIKQLFPLTWGKEDIEVKTLTQEELFERLVDSATEVYKEKEEALGKEALYELESQIMLQVIDNKWTDHLDNIEYLQEGIGLRGYGQQDPRVVYKKEAFDMFEDLKYSIKEDFVRYLFHVQVVEEKKSQVVQATSGPGGESYVTGAPVEKKKIGRNDPCPCGSGKKYKKCCGR